MRWIFVGAGNMAGSLIGGLLSSGANASSVAVVDPDESACNRAQERFGISSSTSIDALMLNGTVEPTGVVIAVKPPIVESACGAFTRAYLQLDSASRAIMAPLLVSVAAGVRVSSMQAWLPEDIAVVRCMPNTPALLGLGATALYANDASSEQHRQQAQALLDTAGATLWVQHEAMLDAVTAVSGSGPAYFFYLIEQMSAAGQSLGLDADTALKLAIETAYGAASMARKGDLPPSVLRENVTSKGGTTAAALKVFDDQGMPGIVLKAMQAAHDRAVELGDELAPD
jgi:pyrroline-5-carboxylate reductase